MARPPGNSQDSTQDSRVDRDGGDQVLGWFQVWVRMLDDDDLFRLSLLIRPTRWELVDRVMMS